MPDQLDPNAVIDDSASVAKVAVSVGKSWFKSKTFWTAVLATGAHYFGLLPPSVMHYLPYILPGVFLFLRSVTSEPVSLAATFGGK